MREWPPRVKVCGLTRPQDAEAAAAAGAHYLGAVLAPGYRRSVTPDRARVIFSSHAALKVGVFVDADRGQALAAAEAAGLDVLQLHGDESPELAAGLRAAGYRVWKAVRPRGADEFSAAARRWGGAVDALLLDGWSPDAAGGTGARFPWTEVAARLDELAPGTRLVAAGGLRPENVADAARLLRPDAVDVSSGVEGAPGVKDHERVRAFIAAVKALSREI
ncbi:MAG TPA: phosphoribosylanthranilate isomerase [Longimicrobium sp.]|nr:phosphoribosylanthranilate isomerase [Longimicrobium sp.]